MIGRRICDWTMRDVVQGPMDPEEEKLAREKEWKKKRRSCCFVPFPKFMQPRDARERPHQRKAEVHTIEVNHSHADLDADGPVFGQVHAGHLPAPLHHAHLCLLHGCMIQCQIVTENIWYELEHDPTRSSSVKRHNQLISQQRRLPAEAES